MVLRRSFFTLVAFVAVAFVLLLLTVTPWVDHGASALDHLLHSGHTRYTEDGVQLSSFASPFHCDIDSLPQQTRLVRRAHKNYVIMVHGFDDAISNWQWAGNGWEENIADQMASYMEAIQTIEPGRKVFMDVGANIASHTLNLAARGYDVHAFEPVYANYALARCSLALSHLKGRTRLNAFGLGDKVDEICMQSQSANMGNSWIDEQNKNCNESERAQVSTLDNYYRKFLAPQQQQIAVAKMDAQGFEIPVLRGGTQLFDSSHAPVVVFFEFEPATMKKKGRDPLDLGIYFLARDYSIFKVADTSGGPLSQDDLLGIDEGLTTDLLAVKNEWVLKFESAGYRVRRGAS